jgi:protoporphyrinogen oxidase
MTEAPESCEAFADDPPLGARDMELTRTKYLVLGGGISGLAFAGRVRGSELVLCEAEDELGGYCRTVKRAGFTWDYSGHFFHFRHPDVERYLVERMGGAEILRITRRSSIRIGDVYVDFPFQKNIHQLPRDQFLACLVDLYFREPREEESFYDMLVARFGRSIAEMFLIPYNEKLYATDLRRLDRDAMGRFFPHADLDEIMRHFREPRDTGYNQTFTYSRGGAFEYVRALASDVPTECISLGERIVEIDLSSRTARTTRREIEFEHLVSSCPFDRLLTLAGVSFDRTLYEANEVEVFNLGFDRKGPDDAHWIYFPDRSLSFYRVGFYDNIFGDPRMSLYVEIGRARGTTPRDHASTLATVLRDLERVGIVNGHELVASHHVVLDPAYVHITKAVSADVAAKRAWLDERGIHSIGRYGGWTYCSIEDNIVEAWALADRLG